MRKNLMVVIIISMAILFRFALEYVFNIVWNFYDLTSVQGFLIRTLFVVIFIIIWFSITLRSENPHQKLPWLLILTFEPILGITLFLSFGRNFKRSFRYLKRPHMFGRNYITYEKEPDEIPEYAKDTPYIDLFKTAHHLSHHQPFFNEANITVLKNGEVFYPELIKAIRDARKFILLEFFIFRHDQRSQEIAEALLERAQAGVEVKMIIDGLGSARTKRGFLKKLRNGGIDLIINDKVYFPLFNTRINFRNHRKIVVIDGQTAFTGGMNIANEYDNDIPHPYYFRDTQLKIEGKPILSLTALFFKDYYYNTGTFITDQTYYPTPRVSPRETTAQIIESGPDSTTPHIRNLYLKMMLTAKKSIKIMTPYMALDQETLTAIKTAARSGIVVDIIVPGVPDKYIVYKVTKAYISNLLADNVNIYQYNKGFCHGKILIIDDAIASVGSYNLDNRSAVIDFEVSTLMQGPVVKDLLEDFYQDLKVSKRIDIKAWQARPFFSKFLEGIMSIFTPII